MSKFRTTELSNPEFETNNLRFVTVKTPNLKGRGDICVFVPPYQDLKDVPIVTLLHGVYGSAWIWAYKAGVHFTALKMMEAGLIKPMILAMPSDGLLGDGSGYVDHGSHNFEAWIVDDVIDAVIETIDMTSNKSALFISGLSMGGYAALRLGAKYYNKYKAISAHSSMTDIDQMALFVEEPVATFSEHNDDDLSVFEMLLKHKEVLPRLRFDCGTEDELIAHNRSLHQKLKTVNIPHIYDEFGGKHNWTYWQLHIKDTLLFFNQQL